MSTLTAPPAASTRTLERNLAALARRSPSTAETIRATAPRDDIEFVPTDEHGVLSARLDGRALASARRPLTEAGRFAEQFDPRQAGAAVVLGFGLGHHVRALAERAGDGTAVIVFEPDAALLRAVLERIDHSGWLASGAVIITTDSRDGGALGAALRGMEGVLAMGVRILEHVPSKARLGDEAQSFCETFSRVLAATRTMVVTTLVQSETTCRNILSNLDAYAARPGVAELAGVCDGRPAITVAAGPSLQRSIELLKTPGLRDRCVIIAAQTVLKPLLEHGVRPHFVTSLDYHAISARFYEGLNESDVRDVTLVVEPKANPAIVKAYPGPKRLPGEPMLDTLLGEELAGDHGAIPSGSTVAHLSYHLARRLGCDPVIMIGQDLGFTDNLYYADKAAIHNVWACELGEFRTLEMLEWERIARHKKQLRRTPSNDGREIYTDEQMATYLAQFERIFQDDARAGKTVIDASEGGARKAGARTMPLAEAIERFAPDSAPPLPDLSPSEDGPRDEGDHAQRARDRVASVRRDVVTLARLSRETETLLDRMLDHHDDQPLVNRLIKKSHKLRDEAMSLTTAFALVQRLNQMGAFKRARADRTIDLDPSLPPLVAQQRRIERDRENVRWIADAADALVRLIDSASDSSGRSDDTPSTRRVARAVSRPRDPIRRCAAVIPVQTRRTTLGAERDLSRKIGGVNPLRRTLARLARSQHIDTAVLLTADADETKRLAGPPIDGLNVEFDAVPENTPIIDPAVAAARLWSRTSWRGGPASLTVFDELLCPGPLREALRTRGCGAALLVGADWALVDPALCDAAVERWMAAPETNRMTFSQAPPGLCGCVVGLDLLNDLVKLERNPSATLGGLLAYQPTRPIADPIAHDVCVPVPPAVRDSARRFIPDGSDASRFDRILESLPEDADAERIVRAFGELEKHPSAPAHLSIELCSGPAPHGCVPVWRRADNDERIELPTEAVRRLLASFGEQRPDGAVTFFGAGDPLTHPDILDLIAFAKERGVAGVHLRTMLLEPANVIARLLEAPVDIVSVDLLANTAATYQRLAGADRFREALERIDALASGRADGPGLPRPWVVPRITRCEAALDEIEAFYDKWLLVLGAATIDPLPPGVSTGRITALAPPAVARAASRQAELTITARDEALIDPLGEEQADTVPAASSQPLGDVWRRVWDRHRDGERAKNPS